MPKPLSIDLRERIVKTYEKGDQTQEAVAKQFQIGIATMKRLWWRYEETGGVEPRPHGGGQRAKVDAKGEEIIQELIREKPDLTRPEIAAFYLERTSVELSLSTITRTFQRLDITLKKKTLYASQRDTPRVEIKREAFAIIQPKLSIENMVFVDESSSNLSMTRMYARALEGERVKYAAPYIRGTNVTMIGAVALDGLRAIMPVEERVTRAVFLKFIQEKLSPKLKTGDIVILDNHSIHKGSTIEGEVISAGAGYLFLPPYSPDFNPIEQCWSKIKSVLRKLEARTVETLKDGIRAAIKQITPSDILGWFSLCGYRYQPN